MMAKESVDILFFSRDPGATNAILPMCISFLKKYNNKIYGKDYATKIYRNEKLECKDISSCVEKIDERNITSLIKKINPKLIVTGTSTVDRSERLFWKASCNLGITSFAVVDSWAFYKERFWDQPISGEGLVGSILYPDYILAVDELAKDEMIKAGIPEGKIVIAGYWHFFHFKNKLKQTKVWECADSYRKRVICDKELLILFLSEPFSEIFGDDINCENGYGYNEKTIFYSMLDSLRRVGNKEKHYKIIVRPHPKEEKVWWEKIKADKECSIIIDADTGLEQQMMAADLILGMQTQVLNDAVVVGKRTMSIQIGLNKADPLFASKMGIINSILSEDDLDSAFRSFFNNKMTIPVFSPDSMYMTDFVSFIERMINDGKISD